MFEWARAHGECVGMDTWRGVGSTGPFKVRSQLRFYWLLSGFGFVFGIFWLGFLDFYSFGGFRFHYEMKWAVGNLINEIKFVAFFLGK
jgi:hypothetical protein